ncbi:MAG: LamG domain-containing protein [Phycisphaerae bacterium]|nr:LamG domain-containing protein [Phycisphaerae bacterium]
MLTNLRRLSSACLALVSLAVAADAQTKAVQLTNTSVSASGYMRIADAPDLRVQQFTLEAWVTPTGNGYGFTTDSAGACILAKPQEGTVGTYIFSWTLNWCPGNGNRLFFGVRNQQGTGTLGLSNGALALNTTTHVAMTFDGAAVRIYLNGVLDTTAPAVGTGVFYDASSVLIGADNFGSGYYRRFSGVIDDVRIWNHARSADEIAAAKDCRLSGGELGLVAYFTFNASSGADLTGHGHSAAPQGSNVAYVAENAALGTTCASGVTYCTSGTSSHGCAATIAGSGSASASAASGFTLVASSVEGQKSGLFFYGVNGPQAAPWGASSSFLCIKSPTQRTTLLQSGGASNACNGTLALDWRAFVAANPTALGAPFSAGDVVWAQAWLRDPPSPKTTALSNALSFVIAP